MRKLCIFTVIAAISGLGFIGQSSAQAATLQGDNLVLTLPDSVSISGTEVGSANNPRKCSIKASLDSKAGTTIPLRAGVVVNFVDSTGYGIDNGYSIADVEGLTHLDIVLVFKCGNGSGTATLKGPYKFSVIWRGISGWPFGPDTPVNVTFSGNDNSSTSTTGSNNAAKDPLTLANDQIATLTKSNSDLQLKILELNTQVANLNSQLSLAGKIVDNKQELALANLKFCFQLAKKIATSKKGSLPKQCLNM